MLGDEMLTKEIIQNLLDKENNKHGTNFKLFGSWKTKGYSEKDIDLKPSDEHDLFYKDFRKIGRSICKKTNMLVEIHMNLTNPFMFSMECLYRFYPEPPIEGKPKERTAIDFMNWDANQFFKENPWILERNKKTGV